MPNSTARAVRGAVKLGSKLGDQGALISGWTALEVENNTFSSADTFSCTFAASALPANRNADWFSQQEDMYVDLYVGTPTNPANWTAEELPQWIYGRVDDIDYDPVKGTVCVRGRDLTSLLIDAKTTEKWQNKTASQIATILANRHGLTPYVVPTKTQVGKYYQIDHTTMTDSRTEWDLLTYLARSEQYSVWVRGQSLFFQPQTAPDDATPYPITWTPPSASQAFASSNAKGLKLKRALTISRGISVTVRTWNDVACKVYHATYPSVSGSKATTPGGSAPTTQQYFYTLHNSTQQGVVAFAQAKYAELVAHEMKMSVDLPGDDILDTTMTVTLSGTGTAWDQVYYPDSIKRTLDFEQGYRMELEAKNHSPDSQVQS